MVRFWRVKDSRQKISLRIAVAATAMATLACGFLNQPTPSPDETVVTEVAQATQTPSLSPTASDPPLSSTPLPTPSAEPEPQPTSTAEAVNDLRIDQSQVVLFPVPQLYAGDLVSIQISPFVPPGLAPNDVDVRVLINDEVLVEENLNWRKIDGSTIGLYQWVWDTAEEEGTHRLTIVVDPDDKLKIGDENPDNNRLTMGVTVHPASLLGSTAATATWLTSDNQCCRLHVIRGSAAHRDLPQLAAQVDTAFSKAASILLEPLSDRYDVYLADRVIGQGGYTANAMVISYVDRNYAGGGLAELLVHEAVHLLDRQFASERMAFLSEGLAVWVAGGHYFQHDIGRRAAALVEIGSYVPLSDVIDNFYETQHEVGYLEAAGFVSYLIETYGLQRVREFYAETTAKDGVTLAAAVDANLRYFFNRSLEEVEADWLLYLRQLPRDRNELVDLRATIRFYDVMRHYQQHYDPSVYYLDAWLPPPEEAEARNTTAEFSRHPRSTTNIALEAMLQAANRALALKDYEQLNGLLDSVNRVIINDGRFLDPLGLSYLQIVDTAGRQGFEVQSVALSEFQATILATEEDEIMLQELELTLDGNRKWTLKR